VKTGKTSKVPKLSIRRSKIHGLGLFAEEPIRWGQRLIEFEGQKVSRKEGRRRERFYDSIGYMCILETDDGKYIDGNIGGNESRFINHSTRPTVTAIRENGRIVFYALEDIARGEELTMDYGFNPKRTSREGTRAQKG
jgi:SET domain-containing protein